ncbi:hypothetical protein ElyMa_004920200 [Elysia marginata]|uniref:Uncharacterized protein n=1 Tax=Elysia marginata TaxID=1093978 RepID=A0AAV4IYA3_9GAST|nr:hypothetical protein ElyMa_004920200 [Elysia marginata]
MNLTITKIISLLPVLENKFTDSIRYPSENLSGWSARMRGLLLGGGIWLQILWKSVVPEFGRKIDNYDADTGQNTKNVNHKPKEKF